MKVALLREAGSGSLAPLGREVAALLAADGHEVGEVAAPGVKLVLNLTTVGGARVNYVRPDPSVFVATLLDSQDSVAWADLGDLKRATYTALIKTMANVVVHRVRGGDLGGSVYFMTPELGFRRIADDENVARSIVDYVTPLSASRMVVENRLDEDLPLDLWPGGTRADELRRFGRRMAALNLLPSPFDIKSILSERDLRLAMKLFGLKQLSYGNLSVREDETRFWMTGRGVDKGALNEVGRDIFLVKGYDPATGQILLSVPPGADPTARVSVDAIEHFKIYRSLPEVGAIVHVHAWIEGVQATLQSWPCGTEQLADEVLALVQAEPDPPRAVVGLKNHGLTITGRSLEEIFSRIEGRLEQNVPALE